MDAVNCSNKSCFSDKEIFKCDAITSDIFDILLISAIDDPEYKDIYEVGTLGKILQLLRLPDGTVKVLIEGGNRVHIKNFLFNEKFLEANYITIIENKEIDVIEAVSYTHLTLPTKA